VSRPARGRLSRGAPTFALALALAAGAPARAHVVYGATTLRLLTLESDVVVRARIVDPAAELWLEEPLLREAVVVAEVLEVLKGASGRAELRFVQHGHGVPLYAKGEEVLLFLHGIDRSRELGASAIAPRIRFVSFQEAGARFALDERTRASFTAAVGAYAELERLPAEARQGALRRITVGLLASPEPELASSALRDLVLAGDVPLFTREDLPALEPLLARKETPIGIRIGLVAELERRGLLDGPPRWAELVRTTTGADRLAAVRAAGAHPSEPVARELAGLLASEDALLVAAAAVAFGAPGSEAAVAPLAKLLGSEDARVRGAAIRGLGGVATPGAREALAKAAASHPDAATRRRAGAEVKRIDRSARARQAPTP
jgi:hypothetical protein